MHSGKSKWRPLALLAPIAVIMAAVALFFGSAGTTTEDVHAAGPIDLTGVVQFVFTIPAAAPVPEIHVNCLIRADQTAAAGVADNVTLSSMCYSVLKSASGVPPAPPPPPPPYLPVAPPAHQTITGTVASDGSVSFAFAACGVVDLGGVPTGLSVNLTGTAVKAGWATGAGAVTVVLTLDQDATPEDCDAVGSTVVQNSFTPVNRTMSSDFDSDGCTDWEELGSDETFGGLRDPFNPYDLFDPNRDRAIAFADFLLVLQHFNTNDSQTGAIARTVLPSDPSTETAPGIYSPRYDRGGQITGGFAWNEDAPDGSIGFGDFLSLLRQFGHTCAAAPN